MWLTLIYKYFFHILSLVLFSILMTFIVYHDNTKKEYENKILLIEQTNTQNRLELIEQARNKEKQLMEEYTKLIEEKNNKDELIKELNSTLTDNSNRLHKLTKEATRNSCSNSKPTTTTKVVEKIVRVPTTERAGRDPTELVGEMAKDFERLAIKCSTHYEELKNEAILLENTINMKE